MGALCIQELRAVLPVLWMILIAARLIRPVIDLLYMLLSIPVLEAFQKDGVRCASGLPHFVSTHVP